MMVPKAVPAAARRAKRVIESTSPSPSEPEPEPEPVPKVEGEDEMDEDEELDPDRGNEGDEYGSEEDRATYTRSGGTSSPLE